MSANQQSINLFTIVVDMDWDNNKEESINIIYCANIQNIAKDKFDGECNQEFLIEVLGVDFQKAGLMIYFAESKNKLKIPLLDSQLSIVYDGITKAITYNPYLQQ